MSKSYDFTKDADEFAAQFYSDFLVLAAASAGIGKEEFIKMVSDKISEAMEWAVQNENMS